jgi:hypothetical protein
MPKPERSHVVYAHYWKGKPFHIGSGVRHRAGDFKRPLSWAKVTGGEKPEVKILRENLTKVEALRVEQRLQKRHGLPARRPLYSSTYDKTLARSMHGRFVVYEHYSPITGLLLYVGSGSYRRAHINCRGLDYYKVALREGREPIIHITHTTNTRIKAYKIENELIKRFLPEANVAGTPERGRRTSAALLNSAKHQAATKSPERRKHLSTVLRNSAKFQEAHKSPEYKNRLSAAVKSGNNHRRGDKLPARGGANVSESRCIYRLRSGLRKLDFRDGTPPRWFPTLAKAEKTRDRIDRAKYEAAKKRRIA